MPRVIHFDVAVRDVPRAIRFYTDVFGWKFEKWDGPMEYWLISTGDRSGEGIDGGMSAGEPNLTDAQLTLDVPSVEESIASVTTNGGSLVRERHPVQGVGYMAVISDPDGNAFGIMESDEAAR